MDLNKDYPNQKRVIAVGNFDGVHLGHSKVLRTASFLATERDEASAAMTFYPHPKDFFMGEGTVKKITDEKTKTELILQNGINEHIVEAFGTELANMDANAFALHLKEKYYCSTVVCGGNFRFGKRAAYGTEDLQKACHENGMSAVICSYEEGFSSTAVRNFLSEGNVEKAAEILGRPFELHGKVLRGRHIGTGIGFPTVNLSSDKSQILPKFGVYETKITCDGEEFKGLTNVGTAPTVAENDPIIRTETFILNTSKNLYDKDIKVEFIRFIRNEQKFGSLEELKTQIQKDLSEIIN